MQNAWKLVSFSLSASLTPEFLRCVVLIILKDNIWDHPSVTKKMVLKFDLHIGFTWRALAYTDALGILI